MVRALKDSIGKLDAGHSGSDTTRRVGAVIADIPAERLTGADDAAAAVSGSFSRHVI